MPHGDGGGSKVSFLLPGGSQALGSIRITWTAVVVKASIPGLVPTAPSPGVSDSADSGWGPRMCISSKFPRAGEAGPGQYFERNCSLEDLGWGGGGWTLEVGRRETSSGHGTKGYQTVLGKFLTFRQMRRNEVAERDRGGIHSPKEKV